MRDRLLPFLLIVVIGCTQGPAAAPPKASSSLSDTEAIELAKAYVRNNHPEAKILRVGPNLGIKEMAALRKEAVGEDEQRQAIQSPMPLMIVGDYFYSPKVGLYSDSLIRIRFETKNPRANVSTGLVPTRKEDPNKTFDCVFAVNRKIISAAAFAGSDEWVPAYRHELAKDFPGIKVR